MIIQPVLGYTKLVTDYVDTKDQIQYLVFDIELLVTMNIHFISSYTV